MIASRNESSSMQNGYSIVILQKRYHPNSIGLVRGLLSSGYQVAMIVHSVGTVEDWSDCTPTVVPYHLWSRLLLSEKNRAKYGTPRLLPIIRFFIQVRPNVVIVKKSRVAQITGAIFARTFGAEVVLLRDAPRSACRFRGVRWIEDLILRPRFRISTTPGTATRAVPSAALEQGDIFLPYPVEAVPRGTPQTGRARVQILAVGSLDNERKRLPRLREAVHQAGLDDLVDCTFAGTGSLGDRQVTKIRELESRYDLRRSTFLANVPFQQLRSMYADFDVFVLPARDEPFGAVVIEAMSAGLPVLVSDTCGSRGCLREGIDGLVFASNDLEDFIDKLKMLVLSKPLREQMGRSAAQHARETLAPGVWARSFGKLLD